MRLLSFSENGRSGVGVAGADGIRGLLQGDAGYPGPLETLIGEGRLIEAGKALASAPQRSAAILYRPPLTAPGKIICIGLNYRDHSLESGFEPPAYPAVFTRFASSLVGHEQPIVLPRTSEQLDYEAELVVVIGRGGRYIAAADALDHVGAYSLFNDASIRDYQFKSGQWTMGKNFDATGAFGPWLVTPDDLPRGGRGLAISTRLNGATVQSADTADMIFDVPRLIELLSEVMTLDAGDVIVSGTPAGVGFARKPPLFMKAGDVCEVEVEGIGILRNPIVAEAA